MLEWIIRREGIINSIAQTGKLDEQSIIDYTIEDIPNSTFNKAILYTAKGEACPKQQLALYEKIKDENKSRWRQDEQMRIKKTENSQDDQMKKKPENHKEDKGFKEYNNKRRCFSSGLPAHFRQDYKAFVRFTKYIIWYSQN